MTYRNLREVHLACECSDTFLVLRKTVGVHEYDRNSIDAGSLGRLQIGAHGGEVRLSLNRAVSAYPLINFGHTFIENVWLDDVAGENFWSGLVTNLERVTESLGDQQKRAFALAFEQRVGCDCGAHLHGTDAARGYCFACG